MLSSHCKPPSLCWNGANAEERTGRCESDPGLLSPGSHLSFSHCICRGFVRLHWELVIARWSGLYKYKVLIFLYVLLQFYCLQTSFCIERKIAKASLTEGSAPGRRIWNTGGSLLEAGILSCLWCSPSPILFWISVLKIWLLTYPLLHSPTHT